MKTLRDRIALAGGKLTSKGVDQFPTFYRVFAASETQERSFDPKPTVEAAQAALVDLSADPAHAEYTQWWIVKFTPCVQASIVPSSPDDRPEVWEKIPGYEDEYEISSEGRVRRAATVGPPLRISNWNSVNLSKNGKPQSHQIKKLMKETFGSPDGPYS